MEFEESGNRVFDIVSTSKSVSDKFDSRDPNQKLTHKGALIINADDWGRDNETTGRILDCVVQGTVSSVSAMVFMADSVRAAEIACERGIDAGLHLNFTTTFSDGKAPAQMAAHQERLARYLRSSRLAPAVFHPGLSKSFEYVVAVQKDEYSRLYGREPNRIDGHHHMHLCANVLLGRLLPSKIMVRRNFSFAPGEKSFLNRIYRRMTDRMLARRYRITDLFFSLTPIEPIRIKKILSLAQDFTVEVETHPVNGDEYDFLLGGGILNATGVSSFRDANLAV